MARISAFLSLLTAIVVLAASYLQWWRIGYDGEMELRGWTRVLLGLCIAGLIAAGVLLILSG